MSVTRNPRAMVIAPVMMALFLSWSLLLTTGLAQEKLPPPTGHINDFAAVLDPNGKERLEKVLENLKERTGVDLVIAIIKTAGKEDLYDASLRLAGEWNVGTGTSTRKSLLLLITADNGRFFTQFSRNAQIALPDGLVGEMGRRMRPKFESGDLNGGLLIGIQTFINALGEQNNFTFAQLDPQGGETQVAQTRQRTVTVEPAASPVNTPAAQPAETPTPEATPTPTPQAIPTPTPNESPTPEATPTATPSPSVAETPTPEDSPSPGATPTAA